MFLLLRRFEVWNTFDCVFFCSPVTGSRAKTEKTEDDRIKLAGSVDPLVCQDDTPTRISIRYGTTRPQDQVSNPTQKTQPLCKAECLKTPECKYWSRDENGLCQLLKNYMTRSFESGYSSGNILCKFNMLIAVVQNFLTIVLAIL